LLFVPVEVSAWIYVVDGVVGDIGVAVERLEVGRWGGGVRRWGRWEVGSGITIITIYRLLSVCRADNRDNIVLIFA
jgi:hypothetical protein